ncbi:MAG: hypothetical protein AAF193_04385, partial [Bacteroidota bacterium]
MVESNGFLKTTNGGQSFSNLDLLNENDLEIFGLIPTDMIYTSPNVIYCSGYFVSNEFEGILKSVNGGQNWEYVYEQTSGLADLQLNCMTEDNGDIFAAGKLGKFLVSNSNGQFWDLQFVANIGDIRDMLVIGQQVYLVGDNGIAISNNGGLFWDFTPTNTPALSIAFNQSNEILVTLADAEVILIPTNGTDWTFLNTPFTNLNGSAHIEGDSWLVSNNEYLWRTDDNGSSWAIQAFRDNENWPFITCKKDNGIYLARQQNNFWWSTDQLEILGDFVSFDSMQVPEVACPGETVIEVTVSNLGGNEVTSLDFQVLYDNQNQGTSTWNGSIAVGETVTLEITVNLPFSSSTEPFELVLIEVNGNSNINTNQNSQEVNLAANGLSGEVVIGAGGDYPSLFDFLDTNFDASLCDDLQILFTNGTHEANIFLSLDFEGNEVYMGPVDALNPDVSIQGWLSLSDYTEGASITVENLDFQDSQESSDIELTLVGFDNAVVNHCSFVQSLETSNAIEFRDTRNASLNSAFISISEIGVFFNAQAGDSLFIHNSEITSQGTAIVSNNADFIELDHNIIETEQSALNVNVGRTVRRTVVGNNSVRSSGNWDLFDINTSEDDELNVEFYNNVCVKEGTGRFLQAERKVQVMHNLFVGLSSNEFNQSIGIPEHEEINITGNIF